MSGWLIICDEVSDWIIWTYSRIDGSNSFLAIFGAEITTTRLFGFGCIYL